MTFSRPGRWRRRLTWLGTAGVASCAVGLFIRQVESSVPPAAGTHDVVTVDGESPAPRRTPDAPSADSFDTALPSSSRQGAAFVSPPTIILPPLGVADLALDGGGGPCTAPSRNGVVRSVSATWDDGRWFDDPDGPWWAVDIEVAGAVGIRVHFADFDIPAGAGVVVYDPTMSQRVFGPYRGRGIHGDGRFWTPTVYSPRVRVEYFPRAPGAAPRDDPAALAIDELLHLHDDDMFASPAFADDPTRSCRSDVTCLSEWADVSRAVTKIQYIDDGVGYVCTGQLLNTQSQDWTPYVLTANHCIDSEDAARSAEFYWLYQTSACDDPPPDPAEVPRSAVATLVATGEASDYTLLMVEGSLPEGLYWAGWTTADIPEGTAASTIHHPAGGAKSISMGTAASSTVTSVDVDWEAGGTQVGSDGAGVFEASTQRLFGQLIRAGGVDCGPSDDFGAFSWTYPYIAARLAGGGDDDLEDNDTCEWARAVVAGPGGMLYPNRIVKRADDDWYSVFVPQGMRLLVELRFSHAMGDIDADLYDRCGDAAVASAHGRTDDERLDFVNNGPDASFRLHVRLSSDTRNHYDMLVALTPANDDCEHARTVAGGSYTVGLSGATNDGAATCGSSVDAPDVWYRHTAACTGLLRIDTCGTHDATGQDRGVDTVLSVYSGCPGMWGREMTCNDDWPLGDLPGVCAGTDAGEARDAAVAVPVTAGETFFIRVARDDAGAASSVARLNIACGLTHDDCVDAIPLVEGTPFYGSTEGATGSDVTTCTLNDRRDVWHQWTAPCDMTVDFSLCGSEFDTSLAVFDGCDGTELACLDDNFTDCGFGGQSQISRFQAFAGTTYAVRVAGYNGATGLYTALVAPSNDACANARPVADGGQPFGTYGADTDGPDEPERCRFSDSPQVHQDVWYCYTAPEDGYGVVDLCRSDYDARVAVYEGCDCPIIASAVVCDDDGCAGAQGARTAFPTAAGEDYLIRVGGAAGQTGSGTMVIRCGECDTDAQCDDGVFCNGREHCVGRTCRPGRDPCPGGWCHGTVCRPYDIGDFDRDGDVDMLDLADFMACFERFALPDCEAANLVGDGWIALDDYAAFLHRLRGP